MGAGYIHACDKCGYEVSTSGPWEFYRDSKGKRKDYGHPVPFSDEAKEAGIYGLSAQLYCKQCDAVHDLIVVEYKHAGKDTLGLWSGQWEPKGEYLEPDAAKCPKCGSADLLLGPQEQTITPCPKCGDGRLIGRMDWIS